MTSNKELQKIFLDMANVDKNGFSRTVFIEELTKINSDFKTNNGCAWARTGTGLLKQYNIIREIKNNKVYSIKLNGFKSCENHSIPKVVKDKFKNERCSILDIGTNIEIDHKNGRYDKEEYSIDDFQPLSKAANDAKRQHCKDCRSSKLRYDARKLGFAFGWTSGDEFSDGCLGCYWYDPKDFCNKISSNFKENK